ncbi:hypothetical protein E4H12_05290 [Candidatus Thorarchaeota archaeon]|nr:MAG: hypothetical protein E4H12_05290 [Candidatus Thorarchaeota archaeon]
MVDWLKTKFDHVEEWVENMPAASGATVSLLLLVTMIISIVCGFIGSIALVSWILVLLFNISGPEAAGITMLGLVFLIPIIVVWHHMYESHPNYRK